MCAQGEADSTEQNEQNTWWATVQAQTNDSVELKGF